MQNESEEMEKVIPCKQKQQMTSASSMHEAGHPKLQLWNNPEGYGKEGGGWGSSGWEDTCITVADQVDIWQKPSQCCKVMILQSKLINQKESGVLIFLSDKIDLKTKSITKDKERHFTMIKISVQEDDVKVINI